MKEESLRSRQAKMQEDYEEAVRDVEKWREKLSSKRKEVEFWMNKVDKSCIERIRAFQTPPVLIGQIMEMSKRFSKKKFLLIIFIIKFSFNINW
jgi:dynein heavy chain